METKYTGKSGKLSVRKSGNHEFRLRGLGDNTLELESICLVPDNILNAMEAAILKWATFLDQMWK